MELTPYHLRWDIYGTGARDGVDPQKVEREYESGDGSGDYKVISQKNMCNQMSN